MSFFDHDPKIARFCDNRACAFLDIEVKTDVVGCLGCGRTLRSRDAAALADLLGGMYVRGNPR